MVTEHIHIYINVFIVNILRLERTPTHNILNYFNIHLLFMITLNAGASVHVNTFK